MLYCRQRISPYDRKNMATNITILTIMVMFAIWTVMCRSLIKATIGLAATSAMITILMFRLDSPMAAVFELSVCAGLMTVIFVSTISLTKPLTNKEVVDLSRKRLGRFWPLPLLLAITGAALLFVKPEAIIEFIPLRESADVRATMWNSRQLDMFGQIMLLIAGALGVAILFEERKIDDW